MREAQVPAKVNTEDGVAVVTFAGDSTNNTFSTWKMNGLNRLFGELSEDKNIRAVVLTAGTSRSFGVGGDFNEVHTFTGGDDVAEWIDACVGMYRAALRIEQPVVAAIEGYAIGIGLQLALCADHRICATNSDMRMPELKLGIACVLGAYLLEHCIGRVAMTRMVLSCEPWDAQRALTDGLVSEVTPKGATVGAAIHRAAEFGSYAEVPFRETKRYVNRQVVSGLVEAQSAATQAHKRGFSSGTSAQNRMRTVIGKGV